MLSRQGLGQTHSPANFIMVLDVLLVFVSMPSSLAARCCLKQCPPSETCEASSFCFSFLRARVHHVCILAALSCRQGAS